MYIRDLKKIKKGIATQEMIVAVEQKKLHDMKEDLQRICHHPEQYVKTKEFYYSGDYYNTNYTEYTPYCDICNVEGEVKHVDHGSYG